MLEKAISTDFEPINRGYDSIFRVNRLSVGLVVPIENYAKTPVPSMDRHSVRRFEYG